MPFFRFLSFMAVSCIAVCSFASSQCPDAFGNLAAYERLPKLRDVTLRVDQLRPGQRYVAQFKGGIDTYDFRFLRREGDEVIYYSGLEERRRPAADFHEIRARNDARPTNGEGRAKTSTDSETPLKEAVVGSPKNQKLKNSIRHIYNDIVEGTHISGLVITPKKLIAEVGSVKILGNVLASRKVGLDLAREVTAYDAGVSQLGFRLPEKSTIVLNDHPVLASFGGPVDFNTPIIIPGRGAAENTLYMRPIRSNPNAARDPSILRHERTHAILSASYRREAFVNQSAEVQEALADFVGAHFSGTTEIGMNSVGPNRVIRNIGTREVNGDIRGPNVRGALPVRTLMDVDENHAHDNSLLISNALWRVRESIGQAKMNSVLKPLIDDLNFHRSSTRLEGPSGSLIRARSTIEYAISSFRKTLSDRAISDGVQQLDRLADELGITAERLRRRSEILTRTGNFDFDGVHQTTTDVILMHAPAVLTVGAVAGVGVYGASLVVPEAHITITGWRAPGP